MTLEKYDFAAFKTNNEIHIGYYMEEAVINGATFEKFFDMEEEKPIIFEEDNKYIFKLSPDEAHTFLVMKHIFNT